MDRFVVDYINRSVNAVLVKARINYSKCCSTLKKNIDSVYKFGGYVGTLLFIMYRRILFLSFLLPFQ